MRDLVLHKSNWTRIKHLINYMQPSYFQGIRLPAPFVQDCKSIQLKTVSGLWESAATISLHLPRLQAFPVVFLKPYIRTLISYFQGFTVFILTIKPHFIFFLVLSSKVPAKTSQCYYHQEQVVFSPHPQPSGHAGVGGAGGSFTQPESWSQHRPEHTAMWSPNIEVFPS